MATRKNSTPSTTSAASASPSSTSKGQKSRKAARPLTQATSRARSARGFDAGKYVAPGAALLTTGALAAAGYALREQLAELLGSALKTATIQGTKAVVRGSKVVDAARDGAYDAVEKMTDSVSIEALLKRAGLQRRSTFTSIMGPAVGVVCGFAAGAVLTHFFGRQLIEQLTSAAPANDTHESTHSEPSDGTPEPIKSTSSTDDTRINGGAHRSIS